MGSEMVVNLSRPQTVFLSTTCNVRSRRSLTGTDMFTECMKPMLLEVPGTNADALGMDHTRTRLRRF